MPESNGLRYLNMREGGEYIGQSYRWMQRHYVHLIRAGVVTYRLPKNSSKGRIVFERVSLDKYMESCRANGDFSLTVG